MSKPARLVPVLLALCIGLASGAQADIKDLVRCQKRIASQGARFAYKSIKSALKCANEISECQIECDLGAYGPPCVSNPPPCCDPDDPNSNAAFADCLVDAAEKCEKETLKIAKAEARKQQRIVDGCAVLSTEELCGAETTGLNFATLNAGCLTLDPNYVCDLGNLIECVGGPLERLLTDEIAALLNPRASEGIAVLGLQADFPGIPITRKARQSVEAGLFDIWSISGEAGDVVGVRVRALADALAGNTTLSPELTLLGPDGESPVEDTEVSFAACPSPSICGGGCPELQRHLPFSGTFYLAVGTDQSQGCEGGPYRIIVVSPSGAEPILVADDVPMPVTVPSADPNSP